MNIATLLENYKIKESKINSERGDLVSQFLEKYNEGCEDKWKKSAKDMAMKLAHISVEDLYWLIGECKRGKNFGKKLNWYLKVKKQQ